VPAPAEPARRWGDLRLRVASAAVLAPAALACLLAGGWAWTLLVLAGAVGLGREWLRLAGHGGRPRWPVILVGLPWVAVPAAALLWLRDDPVAGRANVLFLVLVVWGSDIGAYLTGRWLGGRRLAPRISPGKTWSGALGGLLAATLVGWLAAAVMGPSGVRAAPVAAALGVLAQCGDLMESAVKRRFGVKDSGGLIPGHGGLLDRLDGLLAAAPAAWVMALALGRGGVLWQ
jgi:phosphatidate cytidylyltransferase